MRKGYPTGVWLIPNGNVIQPDQDLVVLEDGVSSIREPSQLC